MGREVDRRKLAAWRWRLARQEASGLTVAAFCRQKRVSVSLWKYWQRQVGRNATVVSVAPPVRPAMPFTPAARGGCAVRTRLNHSYGSPGNLIHFGENLGEQIAEPKELCEPAKFGPL